MAAAERSGLLPRSPTRRAELPREGAGSVQWLEEAEIAARLRALSRDVSAWRSDNDLGQFSLGGAQPKTALTFDGKRCGVPSGRIPTTHILKPGIAGLDGHAENEHFCLALARDLGLPTVSSEVRHFEDQVAIVASVTIAPAPLSTWCVCIRKMPVRRWEYLQ